MQNKRCVVLMRPDFKELQQSIYLILTILLPVRPLVFPNTDILVVPSTDITQVVTMSTRVTWRVTVGGQCGVTVRVSLQGGLEGQGW